MERETGGPAFPVPIAGDTAGFVDAEECGVATGLTIRDYFAAKAMQGMLSAHVPSGDIPAWSYEIADAMLDARAISKATGE